MAHYANDLAVYVLQKGNGLACEKVVSIYEKRERYFDGRVQATMSFKLLLARYTNKLWGGLLAVSSPVKWTLDY